MRKFIATAGVAASLLVCNVASADDKIPVAMSLGSSTVEFWNVMLDIQRKDLDSKGFKLIVDDPQFKVEQQVQDWRAWIAQGAVKAIMGWPINADALVPVTQEAKEAGIPVIGFATKWKGVAAYSYTDPEKDGRTIASVAIKWIEKTYGDKPVRVAILSDEQNDLTRLRCQGISEELAEKVPTASVTRVPAFTREEGYNAAKRELTAHPDTTVWLSFGNDNLEGTYKALLDSGVAKDDPKYYLSGMDAIDEDLDLIQIPNSIYRATFAFRPQVIADNNDKLLIAAAKGEPLENIYETPDLVTAENAKNYYVGKH